MKNPRFRLTATIALFYISLFSPTTTFAQIVEDGDFSSDPLAPTELLLLEGVTVVSGTVQAQADRNDFLRFSAPPASGHVIDAIFLTEFLDGTTGETGNRGFIHIDTRSTTEFPSFRNVDSFLATAHLDRSVFPEGENMLEVLGRSELGGQGFTTLPSHGDTPLIFNIQQTSEQPINYSLEFHVSVVPEPSAASGLWIISIFACLLRKRRSRALEYSL